MNRKEIIEYILKNYKITEEGQIYNENNKLLKTRIDKDGYECLTIKNYFFFVHRLVCLKYKPIEDSNLYDCHHIDHNKLNNNSNNLIWIKKINHAKNHVKERNNFLGSDNPNTHLSWEDVKFIRKEYQKDKQLRLFLMNKFNIKKSQFYNIINYVSWKEE